MGINAKGAVSRLLLIKEPPLRRALSVARRATEFEHLPLTDLASGFRSLGHFHDDTDAGRAAALFAQACETALGLRPRLEQLACGLVMARGHIAEMDTGEGKTIASAFAACLLALPGEGVHVVTVNPYLAARDHALLSPLYSLLGLSSALLQPGMDTSARRQAYRSDILHGSNAEFVFDRLRDGIALSPDDIVQRDHAFVVVDEADSVLLDEASTPLVLSDGSGGVSEAASFCDALVSGFVEDIDFERDVEDGGVHLTHAGADRAETALRSAGYLSASASLYDGRTDAVGHLDAAMTARLRLQVDRDYIVRDGRVEIVDANTGRVLDGRRYADGLHEAVEIKEGVPHSGSGETVSSTTYMNYFGLYRVLCGATGTALSSASEIERLYRVDIVRVPPHVPSMRADHPDTVHASVEERNIAAVEEAIVEHLKGRPVLIGTGSVSESVTVARLMEQRGFRCRDTATPSPMTFSLLNASRGEAEADVVSSAGRMHALTIATNMAGRGTDIILGQGDEVEGERIRSLGGLHVIGLGRHASQRIDDQLRGRAGRRGSPGSSRFHVSLADELVTRNAAQTLEALKSLLASGGSIALRPVVDQAQRVASASASDMREALRQYSAVDTVQIDAYHAMRRDFMSSPDPHAAYAEIRAASIRKAVLAFMPPFTYSELWDTAALRAALLSATGNDYPITEWAAEDDMDGDTVLRRVMSDVTPVGMDSDRLKATVLSAFDECWREHVSRLEILRRAVAFRTYALLQPLTEYRVESFPLFERFLATLKDRACAAVSWDDR